MGRRRNQGRLDRYEELIPEYPGAIHAGLDLLRHCLCHLAGTKQRLRQTRR